MPDSAARVLVVDDEAQMRRMIRRMLNQVGVRNVDENDGKSVLQALKNHRYDLIICDWQMAPTPGIEVLEFVRDDPDLKLLPFIMLTGDNTSPARRSSRRRMRGPPTTSPSRSACRRSAPRSNARSRRNSHALCGAA
ncbi:MAG: response regulator [Pseudomonadota bacterium]